jgi:hypothetical protein
MDIEPNDDVETVCEGIRTKPIDSPVQNSNGYVPHIQLQLQKDCDCMNSENAKKTSRSSNRKNLRDEL